MAVTAVVVAIATAMAAGLLKDVSLRAFDALYETSAIGGIIAAVFRGLKSDLEGLDRELSVLKCLLRADRLNPDHCGNANSNEMVLTWLRTVEEAAYYADNLLDEISHRKIRLQVENRMTRGNPTKAFVGKLVSVPDNSAFQMQIAGKVKEFLSMTRKIYAEAAKYGIRPVELSVNEPNYKFEDFGFGAYVVASDMVGREQDEELIVNKLCCAQDDPVLSVVAIVGMPGIGKTTLARRAYDNYKVARHFQKKIWISVFDDFKPTEILKEIVESVTKKSRNLSNPDGMQDLLHSCLKERRFLLVLDDVRNIDTEKWKFMKKLLQEVGGSVLPRILVTTQNNEVVSEMDASLAHGLKRLSERDSRVLFEREAFAKKSPEQKSMLKAVGERIVKKCNGVPLAINVLGSLLKSKDDTLEWEAVESSQVWGLELGDRKDMVMPTLLLSFNNLPSESAKRCFAYCSVILPKGFSATEMTLVQLWMAHGFLQKNELMTMEDHGKEILKVLLNRHLLQVGKYDVFGEVITYRMHDLMHNLALHLSKGTCLVVKYLDELSYAPALKHVNIIEKSTQAWIGHTSRNEFPKLKLWSLFSRMPVRMPLSGNVMKYLRVLSLTCGLTEVPVSLGRLKHLRYLDLSRNLFKVLPDSIGDACHLQTLKLMHTDSLVSLPSQLTKLINLRHLSTTEHVVLPAGFGQLTELQELPKLNLQAEGWKVDELRCLSNIGGVLSIKGLEHIKSKEDARQSNLLKMRKISELELIWNRERSEEGDDVNDLTVMDGLQPHSNLKSLLVKNYNASRFPPWLSNTSTFPSLRVVSLLNNKGCQHLPTLGHLPSLQKLLINGMTSLDEIGFSFYYSDRESNMILFPELKELTLQKMCNLRRWSGPPTNSMMPAFPCLEVLEIKECPKLVTAPNHFPSLLKLVFEGTNSGKPLKMILSNSRELSSLAVHNVQLLPSLSQELLHCTSLQEIKISSCKGLMHFPETLQTLCSLETFHVEDCDSVTSLPDISGLFSLKRLVIQKCKNLRGPPNGLNTCTSIETLVLSGCPNFEFFPNLARLCRLEKLVLRTFIKEEVIPRWLSSLSRLRSLDIGDLHRELNNFPDISPLPLSLRSLYIVGWPKIQSLPSQLQNLTHLERLALFCFDGVKTS